MKPLIFVYSHPIQYFAPMVRRLAQRGTFDVQVLYCSRQGIDESAKDPGFDQVVRWDIPLLEDYSSTFLPNWRGKRRSISGFWSLVNPSILRPLWQSPRGVVVVHGWGYFTHVLAIVWSKAIGHCVCLRGESHYVQEQQLPRWKRWMKRLLLGKGLFRFVDYFLYIGEGNRRFYRAYGVPEEQLLFTPYSVDNARFSEAWSVLRDKKAALRRQLGLPEKGRIVLFSGKLIPKKRPIDLLEAFHRARVPDAFLLYVGDGILRAHIQERAQQLDIAQAMRIAGFVNQSTIAQYYAAADIYVMCSGIGETWGLSTNEAMNFALPVLLSDLTGCAADLCVPGRNGFIFPCGDVNTLSRYLHHLLTLPPDQLQAMGRASREIVAHYDYSVTLRNLEEALLRS